MGLHFCTYFDYRYLAHGLALHRSLVQFAGQAFTLFVLCLDDTTFDCLENLSLPGVRLVRLCELERMYPALVVARGNRSRVEYYFTLTPALPCYLLEQNPEIDLLAYMDADLYFYSALSPLYRELGNASILIDRSRNVGLLLFRNDESGRDCLDWWRKRCLEWCYLRREDQKFADQGYLEEWPTRFRGVVVSNHKGIGLAPWNVEPHALSARDGVVFIDTDPLVFYHFGAVRMTRSYMLRHNLPSYHARMTPALKELVYAPYVCALRSVLGDTNLSPMSDVERPQRRTLKERLIRELFYARLIVAGPFLINLDYGSLGPMLVRLRRFIVALFARTVAL